MPTQATERQGDVGMVEKLGRKERLEVAHETVLVGSSSRPLHLLTLPPPDWCEEGLPGLLTSLDVEAAGEPVVGTERQGSTLRKFYDQLDDWLGDSDVPAASSDAAYTAREYEMSVGYLLHEVKRVSRRPDRLARAAMASLIAPSPAGIPGMAATRPRDPGELIPTVAADLLNRLLEDANEFVLSPPQLRMMLTIAADSAVMRNSPSAMRRENEYRQYEIPYALSPPTRADRLEEVIGAARVVVLLPLAGGAIDATTSLGQGQFLAAGEYAVGGTVISMVLAAGLALAERALASGHHKKREPESGKSGSDTDRVAPRKPQKPGGGGRRRS
jgi:hypothetical protein